MFVLCVGKESSIVCALVLVYLPHQSQTSICLLCKTALLRELVVVVYLLFMYLCVVYLFVAYGCLPAREVVFCILYLLFICLLCKTAVASEVVSERQSRDLRGTPLPLTSFANRRRLIYFVILSHMILSFNI